MEFSEGDTFGELSFLKCKDDIVTITAESNEVELTILEGYFINTLFAMDTGFAGRFFRYLSVVLRRRILEYYEEQI